MLDQTLAERILSHILPFFAEFARMAQPMMCSLSLPLPMLVEMGAAKFAFPIGHPLFNRKPQVARGTEQVEMIRHQ